jgi:hypothetical protein
MLCCFWVDCKLRFFFLDSSCVVAWFFLQHYCLTPLLVPLVASWLFLLGLDFYFVNAQLLFCCCLTSLIIFGFFLFYCLVHFVIFDSSKRCFWKCYLKKLNLEKLIFVNNNCLNDSRVDCEFLFNLVKLNEKGIELIVNLKSLKIHLSMMKLWTQKNVGKKNIIFFHSFFVLPFFW